MVFYFLKMEKNLKKEKIINENKTFQRIYRKGKSFAGSSLVSYVYYSKDNRPAKIGITASKKIGGAVQRNRAKRVIRAAFSQIENRVTGCSVIFVARSRTTTVKSQKVLSQMISQLKLAGVYSEKDINTDD